MTVRRLITALKKMPQDAKVVIADHDHDSEGGQYNGPIPSPHSICVASREMKERGYGVVIHL
jgi:hypothetical protein